MIKNINKSRKTKRVFTKKNYLSGDGMLTYIWGPSLWHYLHTISFNYPNNPSLNDKKNYKNVLLNLLNTLPCKYCRINLKNNFKNNPIKPCHMKNRDSFSRYVYQLHEIVNKMLNKKSNLSYCDVRERYEHFRARCSDLKKNKYFKFKKSKKGKKESGCTEPLYGKKSRCLLRIVPKNSKEKTLKIEKSCLKKRKFA